MPPVKMTRARRLTLYLLQFYLVILFLLVVVRFVFLR
jgi:hypothetical protein